MFIAEKNQGQWWVDAVIYQVYPRSFADGNGDGIGDLKGVYDRLDHFVKLGINAIWFSPFYPSPQADAGYDVADYFDIDPIFGTREEFEHLITELHARNIKVIIDIVPNHSSDEHEWFKAALAASPGSPERDRYIFRQSADGAPNNWGSMFGGPAWTQVQPITGREEDKDWWYLHLFDTKQPDLNWENPDIPEHFNRYFRFWMDRGVDGFRVDVAHSMVKAPGLPDDDIGPDRWANESKGADEGPYFDQDGVHDINRSWRKLFDEYGRDRMLVAEAWVEPAEREAMYVREDELSQAFNFGFLKCGWDGEEMRRVLDRTVTAFAEVHAPVTWVLSNHDVVRHPSRYGFTQEVGTGQGIGPKDPKPDYELGIKRGRAATLFIHGLPGSTYIYQGEEFGLPEHCDLQPEVRQDPTYARTQGRVVGRDGCRVPVPWKTEGTSFGFSGDFASTDTSADTKVPWLPQPADWGQYTYQAQDGVAGSVLEFYRDMLAQRKALGLGTGNFTWHDLNDPLVLAVQNKDVLVVMNTSTKAVALPEGTIVVASNPETKDMLAPNDAVWIQLA